MHGVNNLIQIWTRARLVPAMTSFITVVLQISWTSQLARLYYILVLPVPANGQSKSAEPKKSDFNGHAYY